MIGVNGRKLIWLIRIEAKIYFPNSNLISSLNPDVSDAKNGEDLYHMGILLLKSCYGSYDLLCLVTRKRPNLWAFFWDMKEMIRVHNKQDDFYLLLTWPQGLATESTMRNI